MTKPKDGKKSSSKPRKTAKPAQSPWGSTFAPRTAGERRYWLVKSEPDVFSFDDLLAAPGETTHWDGIRNYAARNFMRDGMKLGDGVFYYHSMSGTPAIVGECEVVREAYPDFTAFDASSHGFDPKSDATSPTWFMVDLRAVEKFPQPVTLADIKSRSGLKEMALVRVGRLSVTPVTAKEWKIIREMGGV